MSTAWGRAPADYIEQARRFGANNYAPLDVVLTRGEGCYVFDVEGRRYFDFLGGYAAVSQGHRHPRIVRALTEQAARLTLTSRAFHNDRLGAMLERIATLTGFEKVLPMNDEPEYSRHFGPVGYSKQQIADLEATIARVECDTILIGTPMDLSRVSRLPRPYTRIRYEIEDVDQPSLRSVVERFLERRS
jgi:ornithine--oxo-acid transaminase